MPAPSDPKAITTPKHSVELAAAQKGPVRLRFVRSKTDANITMVGLALDYSKAEAPSRAYYADYCDVVGARAGYSLFFGKLVAGTNRLRTEVEIAFPEDMFVRQLWASTRSIHASVEAAWKQKPLEPVNAPTETDKVQTFVSNNVFMAILGEESLLDFFYIAPSEVHFFRTGHRSEVLLEPVIRITLPTSLVFEFLEKCRRFVDKIPEIESILKEEFPE
jgi:hypothetical protein